MVPEKFEKIAPRIEINEEEKKWAERAEELLEKFEGKEKEKKDRTYNRIDTEV